ncbi:hypothetical protein ACAG39_10370 [Caldicellulosiruptoraceae bacterium PP1]
MNQKIKFRFISLFLILSLIIIYEQCSAEVLGKSKYIFQASI